MTQALSHLAMLTDALAHAPGLGGAPPLDIPWLRIAAGLLVCVSTAVVAALAMRNFRSGGSLIATIGAQRHVRVLECHRLSQHADICVFIADQRTYTVVVAANAVTFIPPTPESGG